MKRPPHRSTLFPYTTLFRSDYADALAVPVTKVGAQSRALVEVGGVETGHVAGEVEVAFGPVDLEDRKSTRLNSSHSQISYAVFCLKKKMKGAHPASTCTSPE